MLDTITPNILIVGPIHSPGVGEHAHCSVARSGRHAIELMRVLRFELMLTGLWLPDQSAWEFVAKVRKGWPWQKWGLVWPTIAPRDETLARSLGAVVVIDGTLSWTELTQITASLRPRVRPAVRDISPKTLERFPAPSL